MSVRWQRAFGRELAHAYDSSDAILPVCGTPVERAHLLAIDTGDRPCRRCLAVLGSRRTRKVPA
jgi:hypothetical protein